MKPATFSDGDSAERWQRIRRFSSGALGGPHRSRFSFPVMAIAASGSAPTVCGRGTPPGGPSATPVMNPRGRAANPPAIPPTSAPAPGVLLETVLLADTAGLPSPAL